MSNSSSSGNNSVFRGIYHNSGTIGANSNVAGVHYHSQLHNHLQQHNPHTSFPGNNSATQPSSAVGNHISATPVSLPAPAPVPCKSGVTVKSPDSNKHADGSNPDQMLTLVAKYWFEHNLESSLATLEKDEHEKRMRDLRKQLEYISETNWKYTSVDKFIGQI